MAQIIWSIAPIFVLIVLGHLLRRNGIPSFEFWNLNDRLVYWVLFPALLFYKTSTVTLRADLVGSYFVVIVGGFLAGILFSLIAGRLFGLGAAVTSSVLQGATRHNTFVALAVAERLYGTEGLSLAALAASLLVPMTNVVVVICLVTLLSGDGERPLGRLLLRDLMRNPLLISVMLGIAVNLSGVGLIPVLHDTTDILGRAALPVVLLCVGANIQWRGMAARSVPLLCSMAGKFIVVPAAVVALCLAVGLGGVPAQVAVAYAAVATASASYTLARQMGGDAGLMAAIITLQTLVSFATMPLTIALATMWFR